VYVRFKPLFLLTRRNLLRKRSFVRAGKLSDYRPRLRGFSFLVASANHSIAPGVACQALPFSSTYSPASSSPPMVM
ncbi:hypothetical protein, partial [Sinorhizobium psoraleae]|uniref:hypothetical protein n=1 Tax=Sinorhizobium psoraleae TaxID=520838 RepID=UPI001AED658E